MGKKAVTVLPSTEKILAEMGEQIKLARLRRWNVEKGSPSVAIGIYAAVLHALNNLDTDLLLIAKDDEFGRKMQDLNMQVKKRAPKGDK